MAAQAAAGVQEHLAARTEAWVDFMADTGDGGNPTYAVARSLAAPHLPVRAPPALLNHDERLPARPAADGSAAPTPGWQEPPGPRNTNRLCELSQLHAHHSQQLGTFVIQAAYRVHRLLSLAAGSSVPVGVDSAQQSSNSKSSEASASEWGGNADGRGAESAAMGAPHGGAHCPPGAAVLPRADLLVLGGDLAYPHPSNETYERRFFRYRHPHATPLGGTMCSSDTLHSLWTSCTTDGSVCGLQAVGYRLLAWQRTATAAAGV